jgi:hypothetical protein
MAGHNLQIEQTDVFNALFYNWLNRIESKKCVNTELEAIKLTKEIS